MTEIQHLRRGPTFLRSWRPSMPDVHRMGRCSIKKWRLAVDP